MSKPNDESEPLRFADAKRCRICGEAFVARRKDAKYCSAKCRQASSRLNRTPLAEHLRNAVKLLNGLPQGSIRKGTQ